MLSASWRQPHLLHASAVDRRQSWSVDKSWRCVTLSGFLHSHIIRCRWNPISCGTHYSGPGLSENDSAATTDVSVDQNREVGFWGLPLKWNWPPLPIASLPSTDLCHQLSAIPSTVVCAIPDEVEEGERRHHIMANHGNVELVSQQWAHQTEVEDVSYLMQCLTDVWAGVEQSIIDHAIDQWHMRLPVCIRAAGEHFKYSLLHKSVKTFKLSLIFFLAVNKTLLSGNRQFPDFYVSQGSVATVLRCDGIFNDHFITARLLMCLGVKECENQSTFYKVTGKRRVSCFVWLAGWSSNDRIWCVCDQVMVTNVTSLLKTVKTVEDEAARGTQALESAIEAIGQEMRVKPTLGDVM